MADDIVLRKIGDHPVDQVEVGTAEPGACNLDNDIVGLMEIGSFNLPDRDVFYALILLLS